MKGIEKSKTLRFLRKETGDGTGSDFQKNLVSSDRHKTGLNFKLQRQPSGLKVDNDGLPEIERPYLKKIIKVKKIKFKSVKDNVENLVKKQKKEKELERSSVMINVLDYDEAYDCINDFHYTDKPMGSFTIFNKNFNTTKYASSESVKDFFSKYHEYPELVRKGTLAKMTPSYAFIKATSENQVIPNPIGLLRRKGEENVLSFNNYHLGDDYFKTIGKSLAYSHHITEFNFAKNRLTNKGLAPILMASKENPNLFSQLESINLSFNNLGEYAIFNICKYMSHQGCELKKLNLEGNMLGDKLIGDLCSAVSTSLFDKMLFLNLGRNNIGKNGAKKINLMLESCLSLRALILCWNKIPNKEAAETIRKIKKHSELRIFDISWNCIGKLFTQKPTMDSIIENFPKNAKKPVKKNPKEKVDPKKPVIEKPTPFNAWLEEFRNVKNANFKSLPTLGKIEVSEFAVELGDYFTQRDVRLVHLDISHNNLEYVDCVLISEKVKENHTILGIHLDGNSMTIDELGFIHPIEVKNKNFENINKDHYAKSQIYYKIDEEHPIIKSNIPNVRKIRAKNNCWICEGWRELYFNYKADSNVKYDTDDETAAMLHLNFENYKPIEMNKISQDDYTLHRMCPPGEVLYYYSINGEIATNYGKNSYKLKDELNFSYNDTMTDGFGNTTTLGTTHFGNTTHFGATSTGGLFGNNFNNTLTNTLNTQNNDDTILSDKSPKKVNTVGKLTCEINEHVITEEYRSLLKHCEPRPRKDKKLIIKPRTPWTFPVSIWASYFDYSWEGDTEKFLDSVFTNDFNRCKESFLKDCKGDEAMLADLRKLLRDNYKKILNTYKTLSSYSPSTIWQITQTSITEFFTYSVKDLLDQDYNINGVYLKVSEVKAMDKEEKSKTKNKNFPDNIIRHQFMCLLLKVAKDKYITRGKKMNNILEATDFSFQNHYKPALEDFDIHDWRQERYYNEGVDNILKAYYPIFDALYKCWAPRKDPGRKDTWMILEEYTNLITSFCDSDFPIRELPYCFNSSVRLQVDEIESDRHYNMLFPEFLEALCRAIDIASPVPPDENPDFWTDDQKKGQPLHKKIENLIPSLYKCINKADFKYLKEKFPKPEYDEEVGVYKWDDNNTFYTNVLPKKALKHISGLISLTNQGGGGAGGGGGVSRALAKPNAATGKYYDKMKSTQKLSSIKALGLLGQLNMSETKITPRAGVDKYDRKSSTMKLFLLNKTTDRLDTSMGNEIREENENQGNPHPILQTEPQNSNRNILTIETESEVPAFASDLEL